MYYWYTKIKSLKIFFSTKCICLHATVFVTWRFETDFKLIPFSAYFLFSVFIKLSRIFFRGRLHELIKFPYSAPISARVE